MLMSLLRQSYSLDKNRATSSNQAHHLQTLIYYHDVVFKKSEGYIGKHLQVYQHICPASLPCRIEIYILIIIIDLVA